MKITISKENYLKAIAEAESEGETVIAATLTRWLRVSAPAVTMAIKRLKRDGLIRVGKEGQITLTPEAFNWRIASKRGSCRRGILTRLIFGLISWRIR